MSRNCIDRPRRRKATGVIEITVEDRDGSRATHAVKPGEPLMFALRDQLGLPVEGICGGCATCGSCHVYVAPDWADRLPERGDYELAMLDLLQGYRADSSRLSCQIEVTEALDGLTLALAPEE